MAASEWNCRVKRLMQQPLYYITLSSLHKKTADLATFTEEILNGKLHFLCSELICMLSNEGVTEKIPMTLL